RWKDHPELVIRLIDKVVSTYHASSISRNYSAAWKIAREILTQPHWARHPEIIRHFLKKDHWQDGIIEHALGTNLYDAHPDIVDELIRKGDHAETLSKFVIGKRPSTARMDWFIAMLDAGQFKNLSFELMTDHPEIGDYLIRKGEFYQLSDLLKMKGWQKHPRLMQALFNNPEISTSTLVVTLRGDKDKKQLGVWADHPEFFEQLYLRDPESGFSALYTGLSEKHYPAFIEKILRETPGPGSIAKSRHQRNKSMAIHLLSRESMVDHPELMRLAMRVGKTESIVEVLVAQPKWGRHPEFFDAVSKHRSFAHKLAELLEHPAYAREEWAMRLLSLADGKQAFDLPLALMSSAWDAQPEARERILLAMARNPRHAGQLTHYFFAEAYDWNSREILESLAKSVRGDDFKMFKMNVMERLDFETHLDWYDMLAEIPAFREHHWDDYRSAIDLNMQEAVSRSKVRASAKRAPMRPTPKSCNAIFVRGGT
ncbi:MAG: hypothetical protein AAB250_12185, partial [Bdellovibrionota bacterium]